MNSPNQEARFSLSLSSTLFAVFFVTFFSTQAQNGVQKLDPSVYSSRLDATPVSDDSLLIKYFLTGTCQQPVHEVECILRIPNLMAGLTGTFEGETTWLGSCQTSMVCSSDGTLSLKASKAPGEHACGEGLVFSCWLVSPDRDSLLAAVREQEADGIVIILDMPPGKRPLSEENGPFAELMKIDVLDANGNLLRQQNSLISSLQGLPAGVYLLRSIYANGQATVRKVVHWE